MLGVSWSGARTRNSFRGPASIEPCGPRNAWPTPPSYDRVHRVANLVAYRVANRGEGGGAPVTLAGRIRGCLLGGAIGDALGAPIEFLSLDEIRRQHGPV